DATPTDISTLSLHDALPICTIRLSVATIIKCKQQIGKWPRISICDGNFDKFSNVASGVVVMKFVNKCLRRSRTYHTRPLHCIFGIITDRRSRRYVCEIEREKTYGEKIEKNVER